MFTSNHFELNENELRAVVTDFGNENSGVKALRAALKRSFELLSLQALMAEDDKIHLYRGAALFLHDTSAILDGQISAEVARRRKPDQPVDKRFEV
jgi:hypothetical protein